ncbi:hypothetical protein AG0111_0g8786 [Alternaria gaisen]|uniref:Uncharacterized protein n=1 Tax=Alternaria gaisen TaxID=167740 RepID=A0ACB6FEB1_9PLEO|nr:hypothetical protein AG0111_0g8786 [Alternaria gaisen]
MCSPIITAAQQVNMDTLLPTHLQRRRAFTLPSVDPHPSDSQMPIPRTNNVVPAPAMETWFNRVKEHARIIGLVIAVVTLVVTIVGTIVGAVVTVVVK